MADKRIFERGDRTAKKEPDKKEDLGVLDVDRLELEETILPY